MYGVSFSLLNATLILNDEDKLCETPFQKQTKNADFWKVAGASDTANCEPSVNIWSVCRLRWWSIQFSVLNRKRWSTSLGCQSTYGPSFHSVDEDDFQSSIANDDRPAGPSIDLWFVSRLRQWLRQQLIHGSFGLFLFFGPMRYVVRP